jgi:hypothetical protein
MRQVEHVPLRTAVRSRRARPRTAPTECEQGGKDQRLHQPRARRIESAGEFTVRFSPSSPDPPRTSPTSPPPPGRGPRQEMQQHGKCRHTGGHRSRPVSACNAGRRGLHARLYCLPRPPHPRLRWDGPRQNLLSPSTGTVGTGLSDAEAKAVIDLVSRMQTQHLRRGARIR